MNPGDNKKSVAASLWSWLKGDLRSREERALYRAADEDPFLKEAIQGYQRFPEGKHTDRIESIKSKLNKQKRRGIILPIRLAVAAASIMVVTVSIWWMFQSPAADIAMNEQTEQMDDEELANVVPPVVSEEEDIPETSAVEEMASAPAANDKVSPRKPISKKSETANPKEFLDVKPAVEEVEEAVAMDVAPQSLPKHLEAEKIMPPPIAVAPEKKEEPPVPKMENTKARDMATAKKKSEEENAFYLKRNNAATSRSQRAQSPTAYENSTEESSGINLEAPSARPVGGFPALENYLDTTWRKTWVTDSIALDDAFIGLEFEVQKDGGLSDFFITRSFSPSLDSSLIRVLQTGPRWEYVNPQQKQPVKVNYRFPIIKN